jgi:lipoprotein-releasing system ATP-binding protein
MHKVTPPTFAPPPAFAPQGPNQDNRTVVLQAQGLTYAYGAAQSGAHASDPVVPVIQGLDLTIFQGEKVALVGASGVGKSTVLHLLGLLDTPQQGEIWIRAKDKLVATKNLGEPDRTSLRGHSLGFVYQFHHLLPEFTALENVMMPQLIAGVGRSAAKTRAQDLLERVGLKDRMAHQPNQLSGGQQQRTAIARALASHPAVLLADEPTGNLDEATAIDIFQIFIQLARDEQMAMLIATHNPSLLPFCDRVLTLRDARV